MNVPDGCKSPQQNASLSHWKLLFTTSDVTSTTSREGLRGGGKKKNWWSAELWDKELVTAHQTDPFACGSTPVDAGCDPPPAPSPPWSQQSRNKKAATQTLRQRQRGQGDISTASKTEQDHRHWLISNNHQKLFSLECKWMKPSENKTTTKTRWLENEEEIKMTVFLGDTKKWWTTLLTLLPASLYNATADSCKQHQIKKKGGLTFLFIFPAPLTNSRRSVFPLGCVFF